MNIAMLIGRLTKDPDIKITERGMTIARFSVAVDRQPDKDGNKGTDFISCVAFGKTADVIQRFLGKGSKVGIEGRIQTGKYDRNGETVYTTDIIINRVEFLDSKESRSQTKPEPSKGNQEQYDMPDFETIDADIPF